MTTVYIDPTMGDDERRAKLYAGDLFVYSPRPSLQALADFAREMVEEAFAPHNPLTAQYDMPVERFVEIFGPVKPRFIHHPETKKLISAVMIDLGCDLDETYLDVPRLRGVTSDGYLTAGVGFAHHPHRDTWWSAPMAQLNWWLPIYPYESESSMAYHQNYFDEGIANGSEEFNYYQWNAVGRAEAAKHIHSDTRKQPKPVDELALDPQIRLVTPPAGLQVFSPSHLHSTVANTTGRTRFSMDFRTVNAKDIRAGIGAPNVDSQPTGTSLRDFVRGSDRASFDEEIIAQYDIGGDAYEGVKVFKPA
jgi:hypothetical protein